MLADHKAAAPGAGSTSVAGKHAVRRCERQRGGSMAVGLACADNSGPQRMGQLALGDLFQHLALDRKSVPAIGGQAHRRPP